MTRPTEDMNLDASTSAGEPPARKQGGLVKLAQEGIDHVEAAYQEIDERIELHLASFDKVLERIRENYRNQLLQAKQDAREYVEGAIERWSGTSAEILTNHQKLEECKQIIGAFSSTVATGRYNLSDDE